MTQNLSSAELDTLNEIMNVAVGRAAASLAGLLQQHIHMHLVEVRLVPKERLRTALVSEIGEIGSAVEQRFTGGLNGTSLMMMSYQHSNSLVRFLLRNDQELTSLSSSEQMVLAEVGNIVLNATVGMCSNQARAQVHFQLPRLSLNLNGGQLAQQIITRWQEDLQGIMMKSHLTIGTQELVVHVLIVLAMQPDSIHRLLQKMQDAISG
jgi:chemotaxis protein CheC